MELETMNAIIGVGAVALQIGILLIAILYFATNPSKGALRFISENAIPIALLASLTATLGSLYYSEIAEFTPCKLCWIQRIFMFPQVLLLGLAYYKDDRHIIDYALLLSLVGLAVALFQYYGQITGAAFTECAAGGADVSCNIQYVRYFGYITIPLMSATGFAFIATVLTVAKSTKKSFLGFTR